MGEPGLPGAEESEGGGGGGGRAVLWCGCWLFGGGGGKRGGGCGGGGWRGCGWAGEECAAVEREGLGVGLGWIEFKSEVVVVAGLAAVVSMW